MESHYQHHLPVVFGMFQNAVSYGAFRNLVVGKSSSFKRGSRKIQTDLNTGLQRIPDPCRAALRLRPLAETLQVSCGRYDDMARLCAKVAQKCLR